MHLCSQLSWVYVTGFTILRTCTITFTLTFKSQLFQHLRALSLLLNIAVFFFFFCCICGMLKFQGQGQNLCHSSDNARSLTCCATRELPKYQSLLRKILYSVSSFNSQLDLKRAFKSCLITPSMNVIMSFYSTLSFFVFKSVVNLQCCNFCCTTVIQ